MEWILGIIWIIFLIAWFFLRSKKEILNNKNDVKEILNQLENNPVVIQNIAVPVQGGMGRIDFVVISSWEVFVISVVRAKGKIKGDINSREWQTEKEGVYNPVWRNRLLLNGLEPILKEVRLIPLIVFANGSLGNDFGENVVEIKDLENFFKKRREPERTDSTIIKSTIKTLKELKKLG